MAAMKSEQTENVCLTNLSFDLEESITGKVVFEWGQFNLNGNL